MPVKADIVLKDADRLKLDTIVGKMVSNKEADADIQFVVNDFKSKYGVKKNGTLGLVGSEVLSNVPPETYQSALQSHSEDDPKLSTTIGQVTDIVRQYPIQTNDKEMLTAFQDDNVSGINKIKNTIIDNLNKQKQSVLPIAAPGGFVPTDVDLGKNNALDNEITRINRTFTDYIDNISASKELRKREAISNQLAGDPEAQKAALETQDKLMIHSLGEQREKMTLGNNSFKSRQLVLSPENKLYQQKLQEITGSNLPDFIKKDAQQKLNNNYNAVENVQYDRERNGLESILNVLGMEYKDLKQQSLSNPELAEVADNKFNEYQSFIEKYNTIDSRYPDVRIAKTARFIGDRIAEKNKGYVTAITSEDVRREADILKKENPDWYAKYGGDIDYLQEHSGMIPLAGFAGGVKAGLYSIGKQLETGFGFLGGGKVSEATRDIVDETKPNIKGTGFTEPARIIFDKDDKAYKELPNEDYGKINWNNSMRFMGQSLPGLAEFILLDKGFGKAAQVVSELGINGLLSAKTALKGGELTVEELTAAKKALSISENTKNSLGLFGALTLTGHEQNRKIADDLIDDDSSTGEAKKTLLANLLNLSSFAAFKLVGITPSAVVERALQKGVSQDALKMFEDSGWKITEDMSQNFFKESVLPKLKAIAATQGQNILQGSKLGAAMVLDENTRGLISSIANPDKGTIPSLKDDAGIFMNQIILMTAAGLPQLVRSGFTPTTKDVLYDAGLTFPQQVGRINKMVLDGDIDQKKANDMISMVMTMGEEVYRVQDLTNDKGLPLTVKQKRDIAVENFRKRAADQLAKNNTDINVEPIVKEADATIKTITSENKFESAEDEPIVKIINEETLTPQDVHATAKTAGIDFNSKEFKAKSKELTGEEHLDNMTPEQLAKVNDFYKAEKVTEERTFRTDEEIEKLLNPVDENGEKIRLKTSQIRLPMEVNDSVTNQPKMTIKEVKNRANALSELLKCL